ncbi:hypothetical protein SUNI508_14077 [Seiridium unicorne]|uniref:Uncharacterized protein n=1 Tax=Seiridium unicorne TaxID=138068 RepID=A0ABR2V255_9PEZI
MFWTRILPESTSSPASFRTTAIRSVLWEFQDILSEEHRTHHYSWKMFITFLLVMLIVNEMKVNQMKPSFKEKRTNWSKNFSS